MAKQGKHDIPRADKHAQRTKRAAGSRHSHASGSHARPTPPQRSKRPLIIGAAIVIAALAVVGCIAYANLAQQSSGEPAGFDDVMTTINQVDNTLSPMSDLMAEDLSAKTVDKIDAILQKKDATAALLTQAQQQYQQVESALKSDNSSIAENLKDAISARQDMLTYGTIVLDAGAQTYALRSTATKAYSAMVTGHKSLTDSAADVKVGTTAKVKKALEKDEQAKKDFESAQDLFANISDKAPKMDCSTETTYITTQIAAADAAIAADKALLDNDRSKAKSYLKTYTSKADEAAEQAKSLPASADAFIKALYYSYDTDAATVEDAETLYASAAKRAAADDVLLADYQSSKGNTQ